MPPRVCRLSEEATAQSKVGEPCLRCGVEMEWRHQTWQCPRCHFKIGCCEGDAPERGSSDGMGGDGLEPPTPCL